MRGRIERCERVNREEGLYSVVVTFNQELIPPGYKMWLADCIDAIKPDQTPVKCPKI